GFLVSRQGKTRLFLWYQRINEEENDMYQARKYSQIILFQRKMFFKKKFSLSLLPQKIRET
nr:hypothetical protein [Bacteroidia bacterium]